MFPLTGETQAFVLVEVENNPLRPGEDPRLGLAPKFRKTLPLDYGYWY